MDWKPPTSVHQICSFLGLAGYYHLFIPDFSRITKPMTELLKKAVKFVWDEDCEKAFHTLREHLSKIVYLCKTIGLLPTLHEQFGPMKRIIQPMILSW
jgi:hypothetical protein